MGTLYEIVFDEEFLGGLTLRCTPNKAYRLPASCLLNLSYGVRLNRERERAEGREGERYVASYHHHSSLHIELRGTRMSQRGMGMPQRGMGIRPHEVGLYSDAYAGGYAKPTRGRGHTQQHYTQQQFNYPVSVCVCV